MKSSLNFRKYVLATSTALAMTLIAPTVYGIEVQKTLSSLTEQMIRGADFISRGGNKGFIEEGPKVDDYQQIIYETMIEDFQRHMKPENIGVMTDYPGLPIKLDQIVFTRSASALPYAAVFTNGDVALKTKDGYIVKPLADIAYLGCFENVCASQVVYSRQGDLGIVKGAFSTGELYVDFTTKRQVLTRKEISLGNERLALVNSQQMIAPGQEIYTVGGSKGILRGVVDDNAVLIEINKTIHDFEKQELGLNECLTDICVGNEIVTASKSKGVVKALFGRYSKAAIEIAGKIYVKGLSEIKKVKK